MIMPGTPATMLQRSWEEDSRWNGIERPYSAEDVMRLRGTVVIEHTLARLGAEKLWRYLGEEGFVNALGALTGNQAMQQVRAGLRAIYLSGWQVAADANLAGEMYPDQSLYPADSVPSVIKRINNTLLRADQISHASGLTERMPYWFAPIMADAEAGFGGVLNTFELMKAMIEAGAAGVHFEDQLSSFKKCGHMGGKVLAPTQEAINKLVAARLAADLTIHAAGGVRLRVLLALEQAGDLAELPPDLLDHLLGGPADRGHRHRTDQERQDAPDEQTDDDLRVGQDDLQRLAGRLAHGLRVGGEQRQGGERGGADRDALADRGGGVAERVQSVGDLAHIGTETGHL